MSEHVQPSVYAHDLDDLPVTFCGLVFGIYSAGSHALGFLSTTLVAFLAAPAVVPSSFPRAAEMPKRPFPQSERAAKDQPPRLRLLARTSRQRNAAPRRQIEISKPPASARLTTGEEMRRVIVVVEGTIERTLAVRDLHERTRTQLDAAEHALMSLRDELAAIIPGLGVCQDAGGFALAA